MKIIKRLASDIKKEAAHSASGARKVLADSAQIKSAKFEAMTHGFLPAGRTFDWHEHEDTEEIMMVLKGEGTVSDQDGQYDYAPGDVFVFPANTTHKIHNPSVTEHEMIFVRIKL
ncbi:MAG TPA: cupin domain-containing protein [Candidatus Saccharimonadales bacterium]|nr:cupin domain-containing protein [Candidatus Saccharimonadales bacterium]